MYIVYSFELCSICSKMEILEFYPPVLLPLDRKDTFISSEATLDLLQSVTSVRYEGNVIFSIVIHDRRLIYFVEIPYPLSIKYVIYFFCWSFSHSIKRDGVNRAIIIRQLQVLLYYST